MDLAAGAAAAGARLVPLGCRALVRLGGSCGVSHRPPLEMPMCARLPLRMARCLPASSIKAVKVASACVSTAALSCFCPSRSGQLLPSSLCSAHPACRARVTSGLPVVPTMIIAPRSIGTPQSSSVSTRPPSRFCASSTVTEWPRRRSCAAAASPASPAPMTMTLRRGVAADGGMRSVNWGSAPKLIQPRRSRWESTAGRLRTLHIFPSPAQQTARIASRAHTRRVPPSRCHSHRSRLRSATHRSGVSASGVSRCAAASS